MSQHLDTLKICELNDGRRFKLVFFRHRNNNRAAENSSNNENTIESIALWLSVWKKWCLEKGIAKEIENYDPTHLDTFLEQFYAEIKPDMVKPRKRRFHFIESHSDID